MVAAILDTRARIKAAAAKRGARELKLGAQRPLPTDADVDAYAQAACAAYAAGHAARPRPVSRPCTPPPRILRLAGKPSGQATRKALAYALFWR